MSIKVTGVGQFQRAVNDNIDKLGETINTYQSRIYDQWRALVKSKFVLDDDAKRFSVDFETNFPNFVTLKNGLEQHAEKLVQVCAEDDSAESKVKLKNDLKRHLDEMVTAKANYTKVVEEISILPVELAKSQTAKKSIEDASDPDSSRFQEMVRILAKYANELRWVLNEYASYAAMTVEDVLNTPDDDMDPEEEERLKNAKTLDEVNAVAPTGVGRDTLRRKSISMACKQQRKTPVDLNDEHAIENKIIIPAIENTAMRAVMLITVLMSTKFASSNEVKGILSKVPDVVDKTISDSAFTEEVYEGFIEYAKDDDEPAEVTDM